MEHEAKIFTNVNETVLISYIQQAQRKIVYVAPGVQFSVAQALTEQLEKSPQLAITVILDIDPEVCRLGYGHIEGLTILKTACENRGSMLLHQPGIRIGLLIADDVTLIYAPTPLLIAEPSNKPNAIRLDTAAIPKIEAACNPDAEDHAPEIGLDPVNTPDIQAVQKDLEVNPPQKFDMSRAVRVFNSRIQYVEFKFTGYGLSKKEVSIPPSLLGLADNLELVERWKNNFRVFGEKTGFKWERTHEEDGEKAIEAVTEQSLEADKKRIIENFLVVLPKFGTVILRSRRQDFDARVAEFEEKVKGFQKAVEEQLKKEMEKSRGHLAHELAKRLMPNLPVRMKKTLPDKPDLKTVTEFVEDELFRVFGEVKDVFTPKVEKHFMEVSYETLQNPGFIATLKKAFRQSFAQLFSEYDAALATDQCKKRTPEETEP